jgi:hypothetical protein
MSSKVRPERRGYDEMIYEQHKHRLKDMESTIKSGPPHQKPFSDKWEQDKRREYLAIEFDNKLMLERLAKAVQTKGIDNEMHKSVEFHQQFKKKLSLATKREKMAKLTRENQKLLKSIQQVSPAYSHIEWEEDAKRADVIKRTMALYPEYYERLDKEVAEKKEAKRIKQLGSAGGSTGGDTSPGFLPSISPPNSNKKLKKSSHGHGH